MFRRRESLSKRRERIKRKTKFACESFVLWTLETLVQDQNKVHPSQQLVLVFIVL